MVRWNKSKSKSNHTLWYSVADPRGAPQAPPPPLKLNQLWFFNQFFFIRMLENKARIARESIKITLELPGPLSGPWTLAESEFGSALVMCVLAQNLLPPPPPPPIWKSWIRPWITIVSVTSDVGPSEPHPFPWLTTFCIHSTSYQRGGGRRCKLFKPAAPWPAK